MRLLTPQHFILLTVLPLLSFSVALIIFPAQIMSFLGMADSAIGRMMLQFLGASLVGHAYLNFEARTLSGITLRHVYVMNILALTIASVISILAALQGWLPLPGILILIMHVSFLSGFLFFVRRIA